MIQKYYTKDNFVKSKQDESPKTPYGLALDIAQQKVEDEEGKRWHTDEYALARALLDVQGYVTDLKNDIEAYRGALGYSVSGAYSGKLTNGFTPSCGLCASRSEGFELLKNELQEAEMNVEANARDASNCRAALEETRSENSKLKGQLEEAVGALERIVKGLEYPQNDLDAWSRQDAARSARSALSKLKEAGS